ncbi:hypothetical protein PIROE2DRAFT_13255 [Piromyces sp. E2]|nr:hypothetical protein PIROE2DRAFT_13255 [Piromyces sp. E2]|eukprot:OUM60885.1 hypothetical protein PIROE2DRAFT_13255 [Piromyces sp. E2]
MFLLYLLILLNKISFSNFNIISKYPILNNGILFVNAQLSQEEKDLLLYLHRKTRDAVGASNMQTLYWSSSLASAAQSYAEKCVGLNHSGVMGENLATATYNDVERLYHLWEDERKIFEQSDSYRKKFPGYHSFGHYTQIVWAANTKVGCGQAYCKNQSQPYNLVCRYELGNIINFEVYSFSSTEIVIPNIARKGSNDKESNPPSNKDDDDDERSNRTSNNNTSNDNGDKESSQNSKNNNSNTTKNNDDTGRNNDNDNEINDNNTIDDINDNPENPENPEDPDSTNNNGDKNSTEEASVGDGVNVVAKDDGKGGVILVVIGGTAASGAVALMYVKKKRPDQYKKICRQISMQQKEIGKITKKLTVKVGNGTSTLGRKIIERSKSSATLGRRFKRSKSTNDIRINLSDDFDLSYKFNINNYDLDTNNKTTTVKENDEYNFYNHKDKKSGFGFPSLRPKSYRKLSFSTLTHHKKDNYDDYPQSRKAIPVPKYDVDIIEKMNNLDKYEQYITQSKSSSVTDNTESRPLLKSYQSPIMRDRKGSDSGIDYYSNSRSSYHSHSSNDTAPLINRHNIDTDKEYNNQSSKPVVIDQSIQPPLPTRYKSNTRSRSPNLTKSPALRPSHRYQVSDSVIFPRRKRSLSQSSNSKSPALKPHRYQEPETVTRRDSFGRRGRKRIPDTHTGYSSDSSSRSRSRGRGRSRSNSGSRSRSRSGSRSRSPHNSLNRNNNNNNNNRRPSTPKLKSSPLPPSQPQRMQRKNSLGRKPPSYSNKRQNEQKVQSDEYHNLVLNDLLESYN